MRALIISSTLLTIFLLTTSLLHAAPNVITYQGIAYVDDKPLTGQAGINVCIENAFDEILWCDDQVPLSGSSYDTAGISCNLNVTVTDGFFNLLIGDDTDPIDTAILDTPDTLYLATWFDDGSNGCTRMDPPIEITTTIFAINATLLDGRALTDFVLKEDDIAITQIPNVSSEGRAWAFGDATDNNVTLSADIGATTAPAIRYNVSTDQWEYSNDGASYSAFQSTSGTISSITAGTGLSGGGSSGSVTLTLNQAVVPTWTAAHIFKSDIDFDLLGAENFTLANGNLTTDLFSLTTTIEDLSSADAMQITVTDHTITSGTVRGLVIETGNGRGNLDAAIGINHTDTTNPMTTAITVSGESATAITTALNIADDEIATALALGSNDVTVGGVTLSATEMSYLDGVTSNIQTQLNGVSGGGSGDITGVTAGTGLTGGGDSGAVTLTIGAGTGITVNADDIQVTDDSIDFAQMDDTLDLDVDTTITAGAAEEITYAKTFTNGTNENGVVMNFTAKGTSGAQYGLYMNNLASTEGLNAMMVLANSDTDDVVDSGILIVSENGGITDAIDVSHSSITNAIDVGQNFIVTENIKLSTLGSVLTIEKNGGANDDLMTIANNSDKGDVSITGDLAIGETLSVTGSSTLANTVVGGTLNVTGASTTANLSVGGILSVTSAATIAGTLNVTGASTVTALNIGSNPLSGSTAVINFTNFDVDGSGNTTIAGTLNVTGASTVTALNIGSNPLSGSNAGINFNNFDVDANGNTTIGGTLSVSSTSTLANTVVTGTLNVSGASTVTALNIGSSTLSGSTAAINFSSFDVDASGNITTQGTVDIRIQPAGGNSERLCWDNGGQNSLITDCDGSPGDLAENFGTDDESLTAGDIVVVAGEAEELNLNGGHTSKAFVKKSNQPYQTNILGIISTNPNDIYADDLFDDDELPRPVALAGRVPVKVNLEGGPIAVGDAITSSSIPGVGMKATGAGRIVGIALESYDGSDGDHLIIVFVNTGWHGGDDRKEMAMTIEKQDEEIRLLKRRLDALEKILAR